jgi:hypothetical protein
MGCLLSSVVFILFYWQHSGFPPPPPVRAPRSLSLPTPVFQCKGLTQDLYHTSQGHYHWATSPNLTLSLKNKKNLKRREVTGPCNSGNVSRVWWYMPVIPATLKAKQEDCKFKTSLVYIVRPCLKIFKKQVWVSHLPNKHEALSSTLGFFFFLKQGNVSSSTTKFRDSNDVISPLYLDSLFYMSLAWDCITPLTFFSLNQCFSDFNMNHLEGLLKHRWLGSPHLQFLIQQVWSNTWKLACLSKSQVYWGHI